MRVDDHQIRLTTGGGGYGALFRRLDAADHVTEVGDDLREQFGDHRVVLDQEDIQWVHVFGSPLPAATAGLKV